MIAHIPDKEVQHGRKKKEEDSGSRQNGRPARAAGCKAEQQGKETAAQFGDPLDDLHRSCYSSGRRISALEKVRFIE
jgi:hypothetical protein